MRGVTDPTDDELKVSILRDRVSELEREVESLRPQLGGGSPPMKFTVPGPPVTWKRTNTVPVMTKRGVLFKKGRPVLRKLTDAEQRVYQTRIKSAARKANIELIEGPVDLVVRVYRLADQGDWDNYGKQVSDALNKVAYSDDRQVKHADVHLLIDRKNPRLEVEVRPIQVAAA